MKLNSLQKQNHEKKYDGFVSTLNSVFLKARYFGVTSFGLTIPFCWSLILFLMLVVLETYAIWKVIRVLGGWSVGSSGCLTRFIMVSSSRYFDAVASVMIACNSFEISGTQYIINHGGVMFRLAGSIFYGNALLSLLLSSNFVHSWKHLSSFWLSVETTTGLNFPPDARIRKRAIIVTTFIVTFACVEHTMSMMHAIGYDDSPEGYFHKYIMTSHSFLLKTQDYSLWNAVPIFILGKVATALWNFQDLIIILISMGLTSRYHRLNLYVSSVVAIEKRYKGKQRFGTELFLQIQIWRRVREAYVRQATLVRMVDRKLGPLVLLSNINNLYFICLQLFLGLNNKEKGSPINRCYYLISLGWLLLRACSVVLAASGVHTHSQQALNYLFMCPSAAYNIEIKRLQYQLTNDYVALSAMGFFSLRRKLLLEVAAAILKYELVLIQYDT